VPHLALQCDLLCGTYCQSIGRHGGEDASAPKRHFFCHDALVQYAQTQPTKPGGDSPVEQSQAEGLLDDVPWKLEHWNQNIGTETSCNYGDQII